MSKSKTVTLPREVVERALDALWNTAHGEPCFGKHVRNSMEALIAAMEQQPNHILDAGNMTLEGWKLVPVEPTQEMLDAYIHMQGRFSSARSDWAAMLAAAPQPQTTEQSSAVEQPQGEQEPVAWLHQCNKRPDLIEMSFSKREPTLASKGYKARPLIFGDIAHPQPKREPLTVEQIAAATGAKPGTPTWPLAVAFTRSIEAAHNIK